MAAVQSLQRVGYGIVRNGSQKPQPAGVDAHNRDLFFANIGNRIEQSAVAANAEHKVGALQVVASAKSLAARGQRQAMLQIGLEMLNHANLYSARIQLVEQLLNIRQHFRL